ncbi:hypothetical protein HZA97_01495 [Candidatus Woesearchaeota archaeon]|nr:hypothetical protein [Candidatus Woesearchaeota archaeon]
MKKLVILLVLLLVPSVFAMTSDDWIKFHGLDKYYGPPNDPFGFIDAKNIALGVFDNSGALVNRDPFVGERISLAAKADFIWGTFALYPDNPLTSINSWDFKKGIPLGNTGWFNGAAVSDMISTAGLQPQDYHLLFYTCNVNWQKPNLTFYPFDCAAEVLTFNLKTTPLVQIPNPPTQVLPTPVTQPRGSLGYKMLYYFEPQDKLDFKITEKDYFVVNGYETNILKYEDIAAVNTVLTFTDLASGTKQIVYHPSSQQGIMGEASLITGGVSHDVFVDPTGLLSIDMNGDSKIDGTELRLMTDAGQEIDLGDTNDLKNSKSFDVTIETPKKKIESLNTNEVTKITVEKSGTVLNLGKIIPGLIALPSTPEISQQRNVYGDFLELFKPMNRIGNGELTMEVPINQLFYETFLELSGDTVKVEEPNNNLELNEYLGDVRPVFTQYDLPRLGAGTISTQSGVTQYEQYVDLPKTSGQIIFGKDQLDNVGNFLFYKKGEEIFTYQIDLVGGINGNVVNNNVPDWIGKEIRIGWSSYKVLSASISGNSLKLTLVGGLLGDILNEGDKQTYALGGNTFDVEVKVISSANKDVLLEINGYLLPKMKVGDVEPLPSGELVAVSNIIIGPNFNSVEFFLGANKFTFLDDDVTDNDFTKGALNANNNQYQEGDVRISASISGSSIILSNLKYKLNTAGLLGDIYVPPGHGVKEYLKNPEAILLNDFDISFDGPAQRPLRPSKVGLFPKSMERYNLEFINKNGLVYSVPLVVNTNKVMKYGE